MLIDPLSLGDCHGIGPGSLNLVDVEVRLSLHPFLAELSSLSALSSAAILAIES